MDEVVRRWRQKGTIYFWFESDTRQGQGWHLAADKAGCQDLDDVVALAKAAKHPSRFEFAPAPVSGPTQRTVSKLTLSHDARWPAEHWSVERSSGITWQVGAAKLDEMSSLTADLRRGQGDYSVGGNGDQRIWVWWPPK
jgi:hypothetical protein